MSRTCSGLNCFDTESVRCKSETRIASSSAMEKPGARGARVTGISRKLAQALLKLSDNMTTGRPYNPMSTPPTTVRDGETFVAPDDQPLVEVHPRARRSEAGGHPGTPAPERRRHPGKLAAGPADRRRPLGWRPALGAAQRCAFALPASLDREQEFAVLQVVHQAGVKVPRPLWLCRDMRVHGRVFFLMEYVPGVAAGRLLSAGAGTQGRAQLAAQRRQPGAPASGSPAVRRAGFPADANPLTGLGDHRRPIATTSTPRRCLSGAGVGPALVRAARTAQQHPVSVAP